MTDNDECPLGTLLTGAHIVITSTGYVNLNGGGTEHANDPDVTWQYHISAGGVNSYITILFNGNTTIAVLQGLSLSLPEAHSNGSVKMFANSQTVRLDESTSFDSNEIILRLDGVPAEICMEQMGPTAGFTYDAGTRNLNSALTLEALPGSWLPPAGTAWILGNRVKVRSLSAAAKSRICNFARLGNNR